MPDLTPLEAAEIMEESARQAKCMIDAPTIFFSTASQSAGVDRLKKCEMAYSLAASLLRAIAAGEYEPVMHAKWKLVSDGTQCNLVKCTHCGRSIAVARNVPLDEWRAAKPYCDQCGALMGKDDSHE